MDSSLQDSFDLLQDRKRTLTGLKQARKEQIILEKAAYEPRSKDVERLKQELSYLEDAYDSDFPKLKEDIEALSEEISVLEQAICGVAYEFLEQGQEVRVKKNKKTKLVAKFRVVFEKDNAKA